MIMKIQLIKGDITRIEVEAIVNAANSRLAGGGGVDGAIHRAGGTEIMEACNKIREEQGGCPTGEAVITTGGNLPARYVIHTVGPVWRGGKNDEARLLENAYLNSLKLAEKYSIRSIAFPNISTGVYGYPLEEAADIAIHAVNLYLSQDTHIEKIIYVCYDERSYQIYSKKLNHLGLL